MASESQDGLASAFREKQPLLVDLAQRLRGLLTDLITSSNIDVIQIEARPKTVESFLSKIQRKDFSYSDPLNEVTDLVGTRVITYYLDDVDRLGMLLSQEFKIDERNSVNKSAALATDQFGYLSAHYVAQIGPSRASLPEWKRFEGIHFEIQVRTALQHAWAAVSHKLDYKRAQDAPLGLRRPLFRLSALFELADEQFQAIRESQSAADTISRAEVSHGRLDIPVDASSVNAYLALSPTVTRLETALSKTEFQVAGHQDIDDDRLKLDQADLLKTLRYLNFNSIELLDRYLSDTNHCVELVRWIDSADDTEPLLSAEGEGLPSSSLEDIITTMLLIDFRVEDPELLSSLAFMDETLETFQKLGRDRASSTFFENVPAASPPPRGGLASTPADPDDLTG